MKLAVLLLLPAILFAQEPPPSITVSVPEDMIVVVSRNKRPAGTNAAIRPLANITQPFLAPTNPLTSNPPLPPHVVPISVQMRIAAQLARGQAAPWTQRFIVIKVEESALARPEEDGDTPVFSTNYTVTVMPLTGETNSPVAWGAAKNKSIRFVTPRFTKKGDDYELFPVTER